MNTSIKELFGDIDIYLFDQLLKGRFDHCKRILDIGCGSGRNIYYFLKNGFEVYGIDQQQEAISSVQALAKQLTTNVNSNNFIVGKAESLPYQAESFDLVISSAVFHFAENEAHFDRMVKSAWRVLKTGGYLFVRLASDIGIEQKVTPVGNGRYLLPDGTERFLVNEAMLLSYTTLLNGSLFEPIKTTNVQNMRCMTTWCLQKK